MLFLSLQRNQLLAEIEWRGVRQSARLRIKSYRIASGEAHWLPKSLFDLRRELDQKPRRNYKNLTFLTRWYKKHTEIINTLLNNSL